MVREDLKCLKLAAHELDLAWGEAGALMRDVTVEARGVKSLWRKGGSKSPLIALGIALIAFPEPFISEIVGGALIAFGLMGSKIRPPPIYLEDVIEKANNALSELVKASSLEAFNVWAISQD